VLLVSELVELELLLLGVVTEPLAEPLVEPVAEPLALMSVLEDEERDVSVLAGVEVERSVLMSELLRVDLLQPPSPKASAARAAAPVSLIFCVFIIFSPRLLSG
jgi:hypothetical protein